MSRLYDTIEPSVIDEQMLKEAVEDQGPKGEAGRIAKQEGIDFDTVLALRLDYRSKRSLSFYDFYMCMHLLLHLCHKMKVEGSVLYIKHGLVLYLILYYSIKCKSCKM